MLHTKLLFPELFNTDLGYKQNAYNNCTCYAHSKTDEDGNLIWNIPVPGCSDKDVSVELDGRFLKIQAKSPIDDFDFSTSISIKIPETVDTESVSANVSNGLLNIYVKKNLKKIKVRKLL